jgi:hypothetical protein
LPFIICFTVIFDIIAFQWNTPNTLLLLNALLFAL